MTVPTPHPPASDPPPGSPLAPPWAGAVLAAVCAMLVGLGLARFAYTPLIPPLVTEGWFDGADAAYLGAANLAGYLIGALVGHRLAGAAGVPALRAMMLICAASFVACAWPLSFPWFFGWRFVSGFAGAVIMVLAAPRVLAVVPAHRLGLAGGLIFAGVGVGIVASGTLVPSLLRWGLEAAWLGLGALCLLLTAVSWTLWPASRPAPRPAPRPSAAAAAGPGPAASQIGLGEARRQVVPLIIAYGLIAAAMVPHMVFLVDYVARGLGRGLEAGAVYWVLFGIGAVIGPVAAGRIADIVGFARAMRGGLVLLAAVIGWLALTQSTAALAVSSLYVGAAVPGFTSLALGRVRALLPAGPDGRAPQVAWSRATLAFAVMQAAWGYACSALYDVTGDYRLLFATGAAAAALALAVDLFWPKPAPARRAADSDSPVTP